VNTHASSNGTSEQIAGDIPRLEGRNITVRYGGVVAVDNFSLAVYDRSIVGLVGPNGAGKSTLFNAISGWRLPDKGSVFLGGREITRLRPEKRARLGLARTFQVPELFANLTVRQHLVLSYRLKYARRRLWSDLLLGQALKAADSSEAEQVEKTLDQLNLADFAEQQAERLPIGITRVVEIARAVISAPRILLLDEPSAGLDHRETADLADALCKLVKEGDMSVVLVEHDVATVLRISDFVYVLDFGICIASGNPSDIVNNPVVQSAYLGTAT
jgi:branched-chain amino acid transport system ATP-binding protein